MSATEYVEEKLAPGLIERRYPSGKVVYRSSVYIDGTRHHEKYEGITRTEAKRLHRDRRSKIENGQRPALTRQLASVKDEAYAYLDQLAARNEGSTGTVENYRTAWDRRIATHPIGAKRLDQIDRAICLRFLRDLRGMTGARGDALGTSTQNGTVSALRNVLGFARDMGYMDYDPFRGIARKEFPSQKASTGIASRALDNEEANRLIEAARSQTFVEATDTLYTNAIILTRSQGPRSGEVCGLRWRDAQLIDERLSFSGQLKRGQRVGEPVSIVPPKNGEHGVRNPRMFQVTWNALQDQLAHEQSKGLGRDDDLVFTMADGRPMTQSRLLSAVRRAGVLAGLGRVVPKDLRASWTTAAAHSGMAPVEIAEWTGHTPTVVERFYVKPIRTTAQEDSDMQKMMASGFVA